jgi:RHS repeat-associated protein
MSKHNSTAMSLLPRVISLLALIVVFCSAHAAEKITYFYFDALGSPVAATDQAGNVVWKEEYRPYGARIKSEPAAASNTRWYTGHPQDDDTGLTYAGARFYDPVVGRFMATDPKGFTADNLHSFNRYAYANNNPYKFVDPDGREAFARGLGDLPENPVAGPDTAITAGIIASPLLFTVGGVVVAKEAVSHVTGIPVGLRGLLQGLTKGFARGVAKSGQLGQGLKNVREITSGRLKGFSRGNTELPGGTQGAKDLFKQLTGKGPKGGFNRTVLDDGREVLFRGTSKSGPSKIEIVNPKNKFLEKISFPE